MTNLLATWRARRPIFNLLAAVVCFGMFRFALFAQDHWSLNPCPLCIFQRIAVLLLAVSFLLAAMLPAGMRVLGRVASLLIGLVALGGAAVAARHLYIQSLPPGEVPVCGAPLDRMWEMFPVMEVFRKVFTGSGECAKVDWTFLGLAMPAWVLIAVLALGAAGVLVNWRSRR